ncbi:MAG: hypothetical protein KDK62_06435 [Chlamydiia bacterium]|nr:hypothetical protein [Chlamydiia bacterium]
MQVDPSFTIPISSRRKRPLLEAFLDPKESAQKNPFTHVSAYEKPLLAEAKVEFDFHEFFQQTLPGLKEHPFGESRFNKFLELFDRVKKGPEEAPKGEVFEGWIKRGEAYLLVTILVDSYHSTTFEEVSQPGEFYYIRIGEWDPAIQKLEPDSVHMRLNPASGEGEWMWIRRSPHFSGTEAKTIAADLSRLFLTEASMWDTAKVTIQKKKLFLFRWNQLVKGNDGFFYTDKGFQVKNIHGLKGAETTFTQSLGLRRSAVSYLKHVKLSDLSASMAANRAKELQKIIDRHQPEGDALANLALKVEQAVKEKKLNAQGDKLWLYALLSEEIPLNSERLSMAIQISARSLLLTAAPDFKEVLYCPDRSFDTLHQEFLASKPDFPNDPNAFIRWHLNQAS